MKIILTGGMGFIGSCLLKKLNENGYASVTIVDNPNPQKEKNIANKKFEDCIEKNKFINLVEKGKIPPADIVFHLGACTSTINDNYDYMMSNNYDYSKKLATWALSKETTFIYASSAATYGKGDNGFSDSIETLKELKPLNIYGLSKHLFDIWLMDNNLLNRVAGFKFFNVYGPNEYHKGAMQSVISKAYMEIRETGKLKLFKSYKPGIKDGEQKRDFIYVKDVVDVLCFAMDNPGAKGIYNLGTGKARSFNDLAGHVFNCMAMPCNIEYADMPESIDRAKYQYFTEADMKKLRSAGYEGKFTELADGISDYMVYLKENNCL